MYISFLKYVVSVKREVCEIYMRAALDPDTSKTQNESCLLMCQMIGTFDEQLKWMGNLMDTLIVNK